MTDEALRRAARGSCQAFLAALEADFDPQAAYVPSPAFRRKLRGLRRRAEHPYLHAALRRAAVFFLALLLSGGVFLSVDAEARDALRAWLREIGESFVLYRFTGEDAPAAFPRYRLGWVPEGFVMTEEDDLSNVGMYGAYYADPETGLGFDFDYQFMKNNSVIGVDGSTHSHKSVTVNNLPGDFYESNTEHESNVLFWFDEEHNLIFNINSDLDQETILSLAESVVSAETP